MTNHYRIPSAVVAVDETGPHALYGSLESEPTIVNPPNPLQFHDIAAESVPTGFGPINSEGVRLRSDDLGRFVVSFWKQDEYVERYLASDGRRLNGGRNSADWLHESLYLFATLEQAVTWVHDTYLASNGWFAFSVSEVAKVIEGLSLERRYTDYLNAPPESAS